jgi:hypothetical protein
MAKRKNLIAELSPESRSAYSALDQGLRALELQERNVNLEIEKQQEAVELSQLDQLAKMFARQAEERKARMGSKFPAVLGRYPDQDQDQDQEPAKPPLVKAKKPTVKRARTNRKPPAGG